MLKSRVGGSPALSVKSRVFPMAKKRKTIGAWTPSVGPGGLLKMKGSVPISDMDDPYSKITKITPSSLSKKVTPRGGSTSVGIGPIGKASSFKKRKKKGKKKDMISSHREHSMSSRSVRAGFMDLIGDYAGADDDSSSDDDDDDDDDDDEDDMMMIEEEDEADEDDDEKDDEKTTTASRFERVLSRAPPPGIKPVPSPVAAGLRSGDSSPNTIPTKPGSTKRKRKVKRKGSVKDIAERFEAMSSPKKPEPRKVTPRRKRKRVRTSTTSSATASSVSRSSGGASGSAAKGLRRRRRKSNDKKKLAGKPI